MTTKKTSNKSPNAKQRLGFTYRPDETRAKQLDDLTKKKGVSQQAIVSIAISEKHEREFPPAKS